jgi:hypothetical protein
VEVKFLGDRLEPAVGLLDGVIQDGDVGLAHDLTPEFRISSDFISRSELMN